MIEKEVAINILEDIERCLYDEDWKHKTLSSVEQYIKGLEIAVDEELKELIDKYKKCEEEKVRIQQEAETEWMPKETKRLGKWWGNVISR